MNEPSEQRSRTMRAVRSKETSIEIAVRRMLRALGYPGYRLHRADLPGRPDIAFVGRRKAIFVNGCFWHGHDCKRGARVPRNNRAYWIAKLDRNLGRDKENTQALEAMGWTVLVVWECELKAPNKLKSAMSEFLRAD